MRSKPKGSSALKAFVIGLGVPVLALFALFSLVPYDRMTGEWPLAISGEEVYQYQRWFDQRPDTMAEVEVMRFDLDSSGACLEADDGESWRRFSTTGYTDSARVSRMGDGWMIVFPDERPLQGQHAIMLHPAGLASMGSLYAREVAGHLGARSGRAELVRLWSCGDDAGLFLAEEVITQRYVDEHGTPGSVLMENAALAAADSMVVKEAERSAKALVKDGDLSRMYGGGAAGWGVLAEATGSDGADHVGIWFEPASRVFIPMLIRSEASRTGRDSSAMQALSAYLGSAQAQEAIRGITDGLGKDSTRIADLLAAVDARNAAAFVGETRIGYVRAQLAQGRKQFLERLFRSGTKSAEGIAHLDARPKAYPVGELDPFLRKYLVGDTLRFPRGKHLIDQVVTIPAGLGVVLEKGARLIMAPGAGLVVNGGLHMRGTGLNPVFIRPANDGVPWAGIRVNGTDGTRCRISGLKMSGGSTVVADDGTAGMLSFRDCDVVISKSTITEASGPAMLSATRGSLAMEECYLGTARDALVDLSFTEARFNKCSFMGGAASGIRIKASVAQATECGFVRFTATALTATLKSKVLAERCTFSENRTAVLLTDGAQGFWDGCGFKGNTLAFELRCEKPALGGGEVTTFQNTFEGNGTDKLVDPRSSWREGARPGAEAFSSAGRVDRADH